LKPRQGKEGRSGQLDQATVSSTSGPDTDERTFRVVWCARASAYERGGSSTWRRRVSEVFKQSLDLAIGKLCPDGSLEVNNGASFALDLDDLSAT